MFPNWLKTLANTNGGARQLDMLAVKAFVRLPVCDESNTLNHVNLLASTLRLTIKAFLSPEPTPTQARARSLKLKICEAWL